LFFAEAEIAVVSQMNGTKILKNVINGGTLNKYRYYYNSVQFK
jgi:hypothetical protein